jgi:ABC-2 type transport system permease protein
LYGASQLGVQWDLARVLLCVASVLAGAALFIGLFVLRATLAFWTTESLELFNTLTHGGVETAQFPLVIYPAWVRRFFTYIVPLATFTYFPAIAITGIPDPLGTPAWVPWVCPAIGPVFLGMTLQVWHLGVRRYRSTGT